MLHPKLNSPGDDAGASVASTHAMVICPDLGPSVVHGVSHRRPRQRQIQARSAQIRDSKSPPEPNQSFQAPCCGTSGLAAVGARKCTLLAAIDRTLGTAVMGLRPSPGLPVAAELVMAPRGGGRPEQRACQEYGRRT